MEKLNYTPGPWYYVFEDFCSISPNGRFMIRTNNSVRMPICVLPMPIGGVNTKEKQGANAELISLAPDLYELVVSFKQHLENVRDCTKKGLGSHELVILNEINKTIVNKS